MHLSFIIHENHFQQSETNKTEPLDIVELTSEDKIEQEEIKQKEILLSANSTPLQNEDSSNYRREFFSMLEDVVIIGGDVVIIDSADTYDTCDVRPHVSRGNSQMETLSPYISVETV